jgi:hypothetical protein
MVARDKERYNLELNKNKKAEMSQSIVDRVKALGGRFLQRDEESSYYGSQSFWYEIDDAKALAKTSQALREGAPSIRATAKKAVRGRPASSRKGTRSTATRSKRRKIVETEDVEDEWLPGKVVHHDEQSEEKVHHPIIRGLTGGHRGKILISPNNIEPDASTSNYISPEVTSKQPMIELDYPVPELPLNFSPQSLPLRMHSLCQSEMSNDGFHGDEKFIDPFEFDSHYKLDSDLPSGLDESSSSNLSAINSVLRMKSASSDYLNTSSSSDNNNIKQLKGGSSNERDVNKQNKFKTMRSFMSQLSEIRNTNNMGIDEADVSFFDSIKSVDDASTPGLTSPRGGDTIPTHLIPASDLERSNLERFAIH